MTGSIVGRFDRALREAELSHTGVFVDQETARGILSLALADKSASLITEAIARIEGLLNARTGEDELEAEDAARDFLSSLKEGAGR
jgi:hypothetical protein